MVSAGVCWNGRSHLHFVPVGQTVDSAYYTSKILAETLLPDCHRLYPDGDFILQQDGARPHTSKHTMEFLQQRGVKIIRPEEWPPNSPDMNVMDYRVWGAMMQTVYQGSKIKDMDDFKNRIQCAWDKLSVKTMQSAISQFSKRVRLVIEQQGKQIEHLL